LNCLAAGQNDFLQRVPTETTVELALLVKRTFDARPDTICSTPHEKDEQHQHEQILRDPQTNKEFSYKRTISGER
jgi:hypothetical protein